MMDTLTLNDELEELASAEDFLDYFGIEYDPAVVQVNRLHILQRFHNYLAKAVMPELEEMRRAVYTSLLLQAYQDFVKSDALTEKVFKVFHMHEPQVKFVPISAITVTKRDAA
jgi:nitrogenase-stabilizing/protective protein